MNAARFQPLGATHMVMETAWTCQTPAGPACVWGYGVFPLRPGTPAMRIPAGRSGWPVGTPDERRTARRLELHAKGWVYIEDHGVYVRRATLQELADLIPCGTCAALTATPCKPDCPALPQTRR